MQSPFNIWRQYCVPQHALTRFGGLLSHAEIPWLKTRLINWLVKRYNVSVNDALDTDLANYPAFHDFFIRQLKPELRPIDSTPNSMCSPCDGTVSQLGKISRGTLVQAKGRRFSLDALLGSKADATRFSKGHYMTVYLAPKDYHRVHMPYPGTLQRLRYIPGKLFSVNPLTTQHVDNLFARNERVVTFFEHEGQSFAMILVGAMIVGSIYTRWGGNVTPHRGKKTQDITYPHTPNQHIALNKGDEMGYFSLGSTVILLAAGDCEWEKTIKASSTLKVGQRIGQFQQEQ